MPGRMMDHTQGCLHHDPVINRLIRLQPERAINRVVAGTVVEDPAVVFVRQRVQLDQKQRWPSRKPPGLYLGQGGQIMGQHGSGVEVVAWVVAGNERKDEQEHDPGSLDWERRASLLEGIVPCVQSRSNSSLPWPPDRGLE